MRIYIYKNNSVEGDSRPDKQLLGEFTPDLSILPVEKRVKVLMKYVNYVSASTYKKHVVGTTDDDRQKVSTRNKKAAGQYFATLTDSDIENLEKQVFESPDKIKEKGSGTIHVYKSFTSPMGYEEKGGAKKAVKAYIVPAELTAIRYNGPLAEVHSHPRNDMR